MGQTKRKMHPLCSKENMRVIKGVNHSCRGWLYCRPLPFEVYQKSGSLLVVVYIKDLYSKKVLCFIIFYMFLDA
jgi:hypothetical protein